MTARRVLFACYGSGHVKMVLPVAQALRAAGHDVRVLGLTTAAEAVRAAGLPLLQFKDFVRAEDAAAVAHGRELMRDLAHVVDAEETAAYLGLSYADLVAAHGADEAAERYARLGRQAFLPHGTLRRILGSVQPDLLVATNSPRAERAAIESARALGIPAACIVDLFAIDEVRWIGQPGYADLVCVLNEAVRDFLVQAGRRGDEVVVTGNPAFDGLQGAGVRAAGLALRQRHGWEGKRVVLFPLQAEPAVHPFSGVAGDPSLPARTLDALVEWTRANDDTILCIRPRSGEVFAPPPLGEGSGVPSKKRQFASSWGGGGGGGPCGRVQVTGQDWPLPPLLHATDLVVTLTSTVGLEGHLTGARLLQVTGSVFDAAMPLERFGIADAAVPLQELAPALDQLIRLPRRTPSSEAPSATDRVVTALKPFL